MPHPKPLSSAGQTISADLRIEQCAITSLTPSKRNARTHSKKQIHQIAASIQEFGFANPVLVDAQGQIIAGHCRVEAAKLLGFSHVPAIPIEHLSREQLRTYALADNKLALNAGWDPEILRLELAELSALDLDFDLEITGFGTAEIDVLLDGDIADAIPDPADTVPIAGQEPTVSRLGYIWQLGPHRLLCGDARDPHVFQRLMGEEKARLVFADPTYNVRIDGHVCGLGAVKHREFAMASGEMSRSEFVTFLTAVFRNLVEVSV